MKIVKFADGKYGIRRRAWWALWMGFEFLDLLNEALWWPTGSVYFRDCRGTFESVTNAMAMYDKGRAA